VGATTGMVLSTNNAENAIVFTFTSGNVTAIGGYFFPTDFSGGLTSGAVSVTLSDGTVINLTSPGIGTFTGYASSGTVLTSRIIDAPDTAANQWSTVNDLYVGAESVGGVPEPATTALAGAGALLLALGLHRRRA
jgi:PEP-CTERM motif